MTNHPEGNVTFLFSDIEGSTKIAQAYPDQWEKLRGRHHEIIRGAIAANNGYVFKIVGDEFCCAFHTAPDALKAALAAQQGLQSEKWDPATVKVRMGINTGPAQLENPADPRSDYTGYSALARVSRVMAAGHGGQILVSNASAEIVREYLPETVSLLDMGEHRMR
jgi:class 3 adenylate cyclase